VSVSSDIYFNPWDESFRADPYPYYKPLMVSPPRLLNTFVPMALIARYSDVVDALRNHEDFSSAQPTTLRTEDRVKLFGDAPRLLFCDPPVHTRLRSLVSKAFTPRMSRVLEERIRQITNNLLDKVEEKGAFDVMIDLAEPLPVMIIAEMLGIPSERYVTFKHWSDRIVEAHNTPPGMPLPEKVIESFIALRTYLVNEIEKRRGSTGSDLIGGLVAARDQGEKLTEEELIHFVVLLLLAGNETTTNLIGNGLLALGRHPDQLEQLRSEPSLMGPAIEEMLRYDGPVQSVMRHPKRDIEFAGVSIKANTLVFVILAAANRDPAKFPDPDTFQITRDPNQHVAFGDGIHYCLGRSLGYLEGTIAIGSVLERFPRLRLANTTATLRYKGSYFLRGLSSLPMLID
jgi:pimeloyl-[acyl-carrier protein] synthase